MILSSFSRSSADTVHSNFSLPRRFTRIDGLSDTPACIVGHTSGTATAPTHPTPSVLVIPISPSPPRHSPICPFPHLPLLTRPPPPNGHQTTTTVFQDTQLPPRCWRTTLPSFIFLSPHNTTLTQRAGWSAASPLRRDALGRGGEGPLLRGRGSGGPASPLFPFPSDQFLFFQHF